MDSNINKIILENGEIIEEGEIFKKCAGYPKYYVSNFGRVFSTFTKKFRKPAIDGKLIDGKRNGYLFISLLNGDGVTECRYIHRLVAEAFIDNPQKYGDVHHKDKNKHNNNLTNLKWCSRKENLEDAICVPLLATNVETGEIYHFISITEAAEKLGLIYEGMYTALRRNKKYKNFMFSRIQNIKVEKRKKEDIDNMAINKAKQNPDYMNIKECADWLGMSEDTLDKLRDEGVLPEFWLGGKLYFSKKAVDDVIQNKLMTRKKLRK